MRIEFDLNDEYAAKLAFIVAENHQNGGTITPSECAAALLAAVLDDDSAAHSSEKMHG